MANTYDLPKILGKSAANALVINVQLSSFLAPRVFGREEMTPGSQHHLGYRLTAGAVRPTKNRILRAHMTALARRVYGPDLPGGFYRDLAVDILRARRRAGGR
jgi:hypothetical protein